MYGKPIELLYDKHKDKEIWVVGTGKSIDDFPENFFDDKITIGLNGAMCKYNNLNYYHYVHTIWFEYILNNNPKAISNSITWYLSNEKIKLEAEKFKNIWKNLYWLYLCDSEVISRSIIETTLEDIRNCSDKVRFSQKGSVAHTAIEVAFLMGAKKITLVGCEHKKFGSLREHGNVGIDYPMREGWEKISGGVSQITELLANTLNKYGVLLQRYYNSDSDFYKKGYEKIL